MNSTEPAAGRRYGLLGRALSHSFSPLIHGMLGSYPYELLEMEPEQALSFVASRRFLGINVTIPYKKTLLPLCDWLDPGARAAGSVNTLVVRGQRLEGYNTDLDGLAAMAKRAGVSLFGRKVLVLGGGGAGAAAVLCARRLGAREVITISRRGGDNYGNLRKHGDAEVLINATPVGMYPDCGASPVDLNVLPGLEAVLDMVYNPLRTALVLEARARGLQAASGLSMLVAQAAGSSKIFTGNSIPEHRVEEIIRSVGARMGNLVLIGMPGSGKSLVGRAAAETLSKRFVDVDKEIEKKTGQPVPEYFRSRGEAAFREVESLVIRELGKEGGCVLATGGGAVLREENYAPLKQNALIAGLVRDVDRLPTAGRPVSMATDLHRLWMERKPRYERFADVWIDNNGRVEDTVRAVTEAFYAYPCAERP